MCKLVRCGVSLLNFISKKCFQMIICIEQYDIMLLHVLEHVPYECNMTYRAIVCVFVYMLLKKCINFPKN